MRIGDKVLLSNATEREPNSGLPQRETQRITMLMHAKAAADSIQCIVDVAAASIAPSAMAKRRYV